MATYIHQRAEWPGFHWKPESLQARLGVIRNQQVRLLGRMTNLGFQSRDEASFQNLTDEVLKSSEIEGEMLDQEQVRSSLARHLGMDIGALTPPDRYVEGVVEMMLDATQSFDAPLTEERLFAWHAALFPAGHSGISKITVGGWRNDSTGPMQVVSGPVGRERVHYEAPAASRLSEEMRAFLRWINAPDSMDLVLKAALAHLWFVTIHPFDDGNGRIARAITDLMLARSEHSTQRFYSMSSQIRRERNDYYNTLETTQRSGLDVTLWLDWFLGCLGRAFEGAEAALAGVLDRARFWEKHDTAPLNERQRAMLNRLLNGFEGKLTSSKWAKLTKCSQDTALRDIDDLIARHVLVRNASGGRSTSYSLVSGG